MQRDITGELPQPPGHLFSRANYERMVQAGVFGAGDKVELLAGRIVQMSPQGFLHARAVRRLQHLFETQCTGVADVYVQLPYPATADSMPEPDLYLTRLGAGEHHWPDHALLIIEVADSSLGYDRAVKGPLYAAAQVPEYWIVDVVGKVVEVYRNPRGDHYGSMATLQSGEWLECAAVAGVKIAVESVLGEPVAERPGPHCQPA